MNDLFGQRYQCTLIQKQSPLVLDDLNSFWLVGDGYLDVFYTPVTAAGEVLAQGIHCFRMTAGEIIFGCVPAVTRGKIFALRGYPSIEAKLACGKVEALLSRDFDISAVAKIDRWVQMFDICLSRWSAVPAQYHLLEADPDIPYKKGEFLSSHYDSVIWATAASSALRYGELIIPAGESTPITHLSTRCLMEASTVSSCYTPQLLSDPNIDALGVVQNYRDFFMRALASYSRQQERQNVQWQQRYARDSTQQMQRTRRVIGKTLGTQIPEPTISSKMEEPLLRIATKIFFDWNMELPSYDARVVARGNIRETFAHLGIRARMVKLSNWDLRCENCGYIVYLARDSYYRLLLPPARYRKTYRCFNPHTGAESPPPSAAELPEEGFMLYPPLLSHIKTLPQLAKYAFSGQRRALSKFFAIAVLNGIFFLVFPFMVSKMLTTWIPYREWGIFLTALLGLVLTAFATIIMYVFNATLYIAIKGHVFTRIQNGLWRGKQPAAPCLMLTHSREMVCRSASPLPCQLFWTLLACV